MTDHNMICSTHHADYQPEQFSDLFYNLPPGERNVPGKVYVTLFYEGVRFSRAGVGPDIISCLSDADKEYHTRSQNGNLLDLNEMALYHIKGDDEGIIKFLDQMVKMMTKRIAFLWCDDDHSDFFHSTLEFMAQVAERTGMTCKLEPLQSALEANYEDVGCPHCGEDQGYTTCNLLDILTDIGQ